MTSWGVKSQALEEFQWDEVEQSTGPILDAVRPGDRQTDTHTNTFLIENSFKVNNLGTVDGFMRGKMQWNSKPKINKNNLLACMFTVR